VAEDGLLMETVGNVCGSPPQHSAQEWGAKAEGNKAYDCGG
jgi:hypothetical protein